MKTISLALTMALVSAASVSAQYPPGYPGGVAGQPGISPYLNLAGSRNPAVSYFGIVRPQMAFQNALGGLQQQVTNFGQQADPTDPTLTRGTGHPVYFNNLSHYYNNDPSQPAGARFGAPRGNAPTGGFAGANRGAFGTGMPTVPGAAVGIGGMGLPPQQR
jgi:hypothetical protein